VCKKLGEVFRKRKSKVKFKVEKKEKFQKFPNSFFKKMTKFGVRGGGD
jgi:hypothetical protein